MEVIPSGHAVLLVMVAVMLVFIAGCTESGLATSYSPGLPPHADVHVTVPRTESKWSPGLGCYWKTMGTAYNSGTLPADTVMVTLHLIDKDSGTIRDSRTIALGTLAPGESQNFDISLDGECSRRYALRASVS